jgi:hypothetical protein
MNELMNLSFQAIKAAYMKKKGWSEAQVEQQVLRKYNESEVTNFTEFDRFSIMMHELLLLPLQLYLIYTVEQVLHAARNES